MIFSWTILVVLLSFMWYPWSVGYYLDRCVLNKNSLIFLNDSQVIYSPIYWFTYILKRHHVILYHVLVLSGCWGFDVLFWRISSDLGGHIEVTQNVVDCGVLGANYFRTKMGSKIQILYLLNRSNVPTWLMK